MRWIKVCRIRSVSMWDLRFFFLFLGSFYKVVRLETVFVFRVFILDLGISFCGFLFMVMLLKVWGVLMGIFCFFFGFL